jgi:cytidylate kinase
VGISSPSGLVIAIDGPSGSGKSSASKGVARQLGLRYLDTGAMYRALTWWFMAEGSDVTDPAAIAARAAEPSIEVSTDPDDPWTRVNGRDVSAEIRTQEVSSQVSAVARVPAVRAHLIARQRAIIAEAEPGVVAEGRDIADTTETEAAQARRDRLDAAQSEKAADALLLDATDLTLEEVIEKITRLARERGGGLFLRDDAELVGFPRQGQDDRGSWAWAGDQSS